MPHHGHPNEADPLASCGTGIRHARTDIQTDQDNRSAAR